MIVKDKKQNSSQKSKPQTSHNVLPFLSLERERSISDKKLAIIKDVALGLFYLLLFLCVCIANAQSDPPTMSGEYTIGSTDADYATIAEALTTYRSSTITGDITFLLQAETFNESVDLEDISDSEFQFTIKGIDREASIINLDGTGGINVDGNSVGIVVEDSRNITLENFTLIGGTFDRAIYFFDTHDSNLRQINFEGIDDAYSLRLEDVSQFTIKDCDFRAFAENVIGVSMSDSVYVENNQFSNYTINGIVRLSPGSSNNHLFIRDNVMQSSLVTNRDIDLVSAGSFEISGNRINGSVYAEMYLGEYKSVVKNNEIVGDDKIPFEVFSNKGGSGYLSVYNNIFHSEINLGVRIDQIAFPSISFIHNTVINGGNLGGNYNFVAVEDILSDQTFTFDLTVVNNIFQGAGTSAFHPFFQKGVDSELLIDHNLFHSDVSETIKNDYLDIEGDILTADTYTLAQWQELFDGLFDQNSQSFEPEFVAADDFHITNGTDYRFGTQIDTLAVDIDGDIRGGRKTDVGVDQYKSGETLSGEYIIGTSAGADYGTINEGLNAFLDATVDGDVTFLLQEETFDESVDLSYLPNGEYNFTIRGSDRDGSVVQSSSGGMPFDFWPSNEDGIIGMLGSSNVSLENFTIDGSSLDVAIYLVSSEDVNIEEINFEGTNDKSLYLARETRATVKECDFAASTDVALQMFQGDSIFVQNNTFSNYSRNGIFRSSTDYYFIEDNSLSSNVNAMHDVSMGSIDDSDYYVFSGNVIDGYVSAVAGIEVAIFNNIIRSDEEIAFSLSNSTYYGKMSMHNNIFSSGSNLGAAINLIAFEQTSFINNTVINGGNPDNRNHFFAFENVLSDRTFTFELFIVNNIFRGINAEALNIMTWKGVESELVIDHNLLYSDIDVAVSTGYLQVEDVQIDAGTYNFEEWQAQFAGLFGQNSQSFEPSFVSEEDFHITNSIDYRFGTYIDTLAVDIDGDTRIEGSVDVGADQSVCEESSSSFDVVVFDQFVWEGDVFNESGTYAKDFVSNVGCDSTATMNLTLLSLESETFITVDENTEGAFYKLAANEEVTFSLGTGKEEEWFTLIEGELSFINPPDFEVPFEEGEDNDYFIDVIATDASGNTSSIELIVSIVDVDETVLGAEELANSITFYPNPVTDYVFFTSRKELNIRVMTLDGRLLLDQIVSGSMDLSHLSPGSYFLEITENNQQITTRIIKNN